MRKLVKKVIPREKGKISKQVLIQWIAQAPDQVPYEALGGLLERESEGQFKMVKNDETI